MLDPETTAHADLRSGLAPWVNRGALRRTILSDSLKCDVAIVGAGITGSLIAEHLTRLNRQVCVIDRERPGLGSTAASTSMLMWEIDKSLAELTELYGFERAAGIYHRSIAAAEGLRILAHDLRLDADLRPRNSLYIASDAGGPHALLRETELRQRAGLPSSYLDHKTLQQEFRLERPAAIHSTGSADADPLRLAHALMQFAVAGGATLIDAQATAYHDQGDTVVIELDGNFVIEARHVVLATGYVMPDIVKSSLHELSSSWALATVPQAGGDLWRDGVLIWEAAEDYIYARTTADHRIIIGGEDDDDAVEPEARDRQSADKARILARKLEQLWPAADTRADYVWSGTFGSTADGLPLIGPVPGRRRIYAAYGYGGNGITFSYMASRIIGQLIGGQRHDWFDHYALDRAV